MGLRYRNRVGTKDAWINISKSGVSTSFKFGDDITVNSKQGTTVNLGGGFYWKSSKPKSKRLDLPSGEMSDMTFAIISGIFTCLGWGLFFLFVYFCFFA